MVRVAGARCLHLELIASILLTKDSIMKHYMSLKKTNEKNSLYHVVFSYKVSWFCILTIRSTYW